MDESVRAAFDATSDFPGEGIRSGCCAPLDSLDFNTLDEVIACCGNLSGSLGDVARSRLDDECTGAAIKAMRDALETAIGGDAGDRLERFFASHPVRNEWTWKRLQTARRNLATK